MNAQRAEPRRGWRTAGLVGAACVACCAGPLLAAVGGLGALGSLGAFLVSPVVGLAAAALTVAAAVVLRRRPSTREERGTLPPQVPTRGD